MGHKIEKILVAIDFSDTTEQLVEVIHKFHQTFSPEFILLHVLTPQVLEHLYKTSFSGKEQAREFALKEAAPLWKKLEESLEGVSFQKEIREGIPHKAIGTCAQELQCDLILVGCHLRPRFQEIFVGSTTKSILDATPIPVVMVKSKNR